MLQLEVGGINRMKPVRIYCVAASQRFPPQIWNLDVKKIQLFEI